MGINRPPDWVPRPRGPGRGVRRSTTRTPRGWPTPPGRRGPRSGRRTRTTTAPSPTSRSSAPRPPPLGPPATDPAHCPNMGGSPIFFWGGGWFVGAGHPWVPNPSMCRIEGGDRISVWAPDPAPLPLRVGGEAIFSPAFPHPLDHRGGILIHCPQRTGRGRALFHSGAQQWRSMVRGWPPRWRPPGPRGPRRPEP